MKTKIADRVDLENVYFERQTHTRVQQAIVRYGKSTGNLYFNPKMVKILKLHEWSYCQVGIDKSTKIIVLKESDVEEFGSVKVKTPSAKAKETNKDCRLIRIKHLVRGANVLLSSNYRAERDGVMIFLEEVEENVS